MRSLQAGFALPTILITSVIMLIVLVSAVSAASSVNASLDREFYKQLAREAAESGLVRAVDCLKDNNYVPQWGFGGGSGDYLYPGSTCVGESSSCIATEECVLLFSLSYVERGLYRTYFTVYSPSDDGDSHRVLSTGFVQLLRPDNSVYETISASASLRVPQSDSVDDVDAIIFGE